MGSNTTKSFNAQGRDDLLQFDPDNLVIVEDKEHNLYDERIHLPLDEALVRNIMSCGVLVPVIVRKNGEAADGTPIVEVVDGRQRVRAAREANQRLIAEGKEPVRVPAVRRRAEPVDLYGVMISTNEIRQSDAPLAKARKLQRYLNMGRTEDEAAITFGCTVSTIKNLLALLDCHKEVQKAVETGTIPSTVACQLAKFPQEEQPGELAKLVAEGVTKGAVAVERVKAARNGRSTEPKSRVRSARFVQAWRAQLKNVDTKQGEIAQAVLDYVLGKDRALANFPQLREAAKQVET